MSISGVNGALADAYQYANRTQKTSTSRAGFTEQLQKTNGRRGGHIKSKCISKISGTEVWPYYGAECRK